MDVGTRNALRVCVLAAGDDNLLNFSFVFLNRTSANTFYCFRSRLRYVKGHADATQASPYVYLLGATGTLAVSSIPEFADPSLVLREHYVYSTLLRVEKQMLWRTSCGLTRLERRVRDCSAQCGHFLH